MSDALEQLRAAMRRVGGVNALTGPLLEQQLDLVAWYEAGRWQKWNQQRREGRVGPYSWATAGDMVRSIEQRHEALAPWSPHAARGAAP